MVSLLPDSIHALNCHQIYTYQFLKDIYPRMICHHLTIKSKLCLRFPPDVFTPPALLSSRAAFIYALPSPRLFFSCQTCFTFQALCKRHRPCCSHTAFFHCPTPSLWPLALFSFCQGKFSMLWCCYVSAHFPTKRSPAWGQNLGLFCSQCQTLRLALSSAIITFFGMKLQYLKSAWNNMVSQYQFF